MATLLGNDVSIFQGDINYDVYKTNSNFIFMKATEGIGYIDPKFKRNQSEARRIGMPLGFYHFGRPDLGNRAEAEADYFLTVCGQLKQGDLLALDYESPNQTPADVIWCLAFLNEIYVKTKVRPFIYLNQSQVTGFNWKIVVDGNYALWIASYTFDPTTNSFVTGAWPSAAMQQWTNKQTVPGIISKVDGDVFFGDKDMLIRYGYGSSDLPQPDYKALYEKARNKLDRIKAITLE